ncbi:FimB/Mfa2 family fimbrial subunit [Sphingobacterium spiritivorum]|uniref:FimB/Mfa2 family fimbrial subunit n=1 Tax=Sphingobacterium spiritivorum TaxID=258 RepID=UPI003DA28ACA
MERRRLPILMMMCMYTLTLLSCIKEKFIISDNNPGANNTTEVTFALTLPGLSQNISTYAITDNEENKISTIDVLVFLVSGSTETFSYKVAGRNIRPLTANSSQFQVTLQTNENNNYRLVVIANARDVVNATPITASDAKATVLNKLVINKPGVWNTTSATDYSPLPMWGESSALKINNSLTGTVPVDMLRSQARVDVVVAPTLAPVFRMTSVSVYNSSSNGRIAPAAGNYSPGSGQGQGKVTAPSMPASPAINSTPLVYTTTSMSSLQEIYLFEKTKAASAGASGAVALIIGGKYNGSNTETYYKVEFLSNTATPVPLHLLRNHKYVFTIKTVDGDGYATKEAALNARPSNMQTTLTTINLNDMPIVYFDEHYYLALETDLVNYITDQGGGQFYKIITDAPGGWTWISSDPSWLSMNPYNDGANITVMINQGNPATPRHGTLTITAGKIRARIKVYQGYGTNPLPNIP